MILEIGVFDTVAVRIDDCIEDTRLTPEQTEDYLNRMRRAAIKTYRALPADVVVPALTEDDES